MKLTQYFFRYLALIAVFAGLTACGVAGLAYNNAPMLASYYADDWLDLTTEQRDWLKPRVATLLEWHRANELPVYRKLLAEASTTLDNSANPAPEISRLYAESRQAFQRITIQALPDMVALVQKVELQQISYLEKKFASDNRKLAREMGEPNEARLTKRVERNIGRFESWMGKLTPAQIDLIKQYAANVPDTESLRLEDRRRWQREFISFLKSKPTEASAETELRLLLFAPNKRRGLAYSTAWQRQQDASLQLTADLFAIAITNPKQKQAIQKKLAGYASDVSSLLKS